MNKKLKVVFWSNSPLARTGLGRNTKSVMSYLYKTNKYELVMYCMGQIDGSPDFQKLPYKTIGSIPADQNIINQINQNPHPSIGYGGYLLDEMVKNEKPDVLILSDDFWAGTHTGFYEKPWFNKINSVLHCTIDSEPVLPDALKYRDKIKHYFVWADFAESLLNTDGFSHIKTITGAIDPRPFRKLHGFEKLELRHKYNIPPNAFIAMMVSRNQLRKEFPALIEGFAKFNKETTSNSYLILHTHVPEGNGWEIPRLLEEFNVKNSVLFTYICQSCHEIDVKTYDGQDVDCRFCGGQKTSITCNVNIGCSEEDLNNVYNLADCYAHPANAAGLELGLIEALYTELPIATCAYSGTTMFTKNDFCYSIDFSWGRQVGTNFKRAIPYVPSITKFFNKIYKLPINKRQELGKIGRRYALDTFSPEVVGKQWESFLDTIEPVDYNFQWGEELKNDKYPFNQTISDDTEWVTDLYKNILLCEPDEQGLNNWIDGLKNGRSREDIYNFFINLAKEQNQSKQQIQLEDLFDKNDLRKRVLITLPCSLGDHVIATSLIPSIIEKYPKDKYSVYLSCDPKYNEVYMGNDDIRLIPFVPALRQELLVIGAGQDKGLVNVFIDLASSTQVHLNYLTNKYE